MAENKWRSLMLIIIPKFFRVKWKPFLKKKRIKFQGPLPHHLFFNLPQKSEPKAPHVALGTSVGTPPSDSGVRRHRPHGTRPRTPSPQTGVVSCGFRPHAGGHPGGTGRCLLLGNHGNFGGENVGDVLMEVIDSRSLDRKLVDEKPIYTELIQPIYIGVK